MKLPDPPHPLRPRRQKCSPEMERSLLLTESRARHDTHTRRIEEAEAVERVWGAVFSLRLFDGAGWEGNGRVEVHGSLVRAGVVSICQELAGMEQEEGERGSETESIPAVPDK